jgi:hypothetical protein
VPVSAPHGREIASAARTAAIAASSGSCSQTRTTSQPAAARAVSAARSRSTPTGQPAAAGRREIAAYTATQPWASQIQEPYALGGRVGFARRLVRRTARRAVRKSVRRVTPGPVRKVTHPARTVKYAVTPRPVRQVSRAVYTVRNPLGAAENKVMGAALNAGRGRRRTVGLGLFWISFGRRRGRRRQSNPPAASTGTSRPARHRNGAVKAPVGLGAARLRRDCGTVGTAGPRRASRLGSS